MNNQEWFCEKCEVKSSIEFGEGANLWAVSQELSRSHRNESPSCHAENGSRFVKVQVHAQEETAPKETQLEGDCLIWKLIFRIDANAYGIVDVAHAMNVGDGVIVRSRAINATTKVVASESSCFVPGVMAAQNPGGTWHIKKRLAPW